MADSLSVHRSAVASLGRRRLLQVALGSAAGLVLPVGLSGCRRGEGPQLVAAKGSIPAAWIERLPPSWQLHLVEGSDSVFKALAAGDGPAGPSPDLVSLPDGWATAVARSRLQPLVAAGLQERLQDVAQPLSRLFLPQGAPELAFPWAFSPWVIVLRNQPELAKRVRGGEGWRVLEDPALRGRLVLPSSPRVVVEICGADLARLQRLRANAQAYNDADGLNLLLGGDALAAVLPLQRLIPLLRRDPRLEAVLPASGAPLTWQLLLRPAGSRAQPPREWLAALLEMPLLGTLMAAGWVPPLPPSALAAALALQPQRLHELLVPPDPVWRRCWSLTPLTAQQQLALQTFWDAAEPVGDGAASAG